jgi:WD40 repeat protein
MSSSSEEENSSDSDAADFADAVSRDTITSLSPQSPPAQRQPISTETPTPFPILISPKDVEGPVAEERKSDVDLITPASPTALPEGCFLLKKIDNEGNKITVLARANEKGEIITIEDNDGSNTKELLGDMDEVMTRLKELRTVESSGKTEGHNTLEEKVQVPNDNEMQRTATFVANSAVKTRSHKRHQHALDELRQLQNIAAHEQAIWVLKFEPVVTVGSRFFFSTGGQDNLVRVWLCQRTPTGASPRHSRLWSNKFGKNEAVYETTRWRIVEEPHRTYVGHTSDVVDVAWSPTATVGENGGRYLLSASLDKTVRLWHTSREECLCIFAHPKSVTSVDFHPSKSGKLRFLTGCFDCKVRVWDVESGNVQQWTQVQNIITAAAFRPDGDLICVGLIDGVCLFLHYDGLKFYTQIECRNKRGKHRKGCKVTGLQWSSRNDGTLLVSTNDSRARLWRSRDFSQIMKYKGNLNETMQIHSSFSPDGGMIVSGSEDGRVVLWRTDHDWYQPGKSTARMTGYSREKNNSYESFDASSTTSCTATAFMPFMTTVRDAVVASAKRKLSAGIITQDEFAMIIMSQAKHDLQMSETDGDVKRHRTETPTTSVSIVTADADGMLKLFVSGVTDDDDDGNDEGGDEGGGEEDILEVLVPATSLLAPETPPPLPPPRRKSLQSDDDQSNSYSLPPPLPPKRNNNDAQSTKILPPKVPSRRRSNGDEVTK